MFVLLREKIYGSEERLAVRCFKSFAVFLFCVSLGHGTCVCKEKLLWNSGGGSISDCGVTRWNFGLVRMEKEKIEIRQNDNHKNRKYLSVVCIPCIAGTSVCRDLERGFQDGMGSGRSLVWRSFRGDGGSGRHQQHGILFFCVSQ